MANKKITDLTALTSADSTDVLPIVDVSANTTKKVTVDGLIATGSISTAKLANGAVITAKQTAVTYTGNMSSVATVTTSFQNAASVTLPAYGVAHKYLIIAAFDVNNNASGAVRDYTVAIRNGTTTLKASIWTANADEYHNTVPVNHVLTSSTAGGETINFSVARNADSGGNLNSLSHYSIVDLGVA